MGAKLHSSRFLARASAQMQDAWSSPNPIVIIQPQQKNRAGAGGRMLERPEQQGKTAICTNRGDENALGQTVQQHPERRSLPAASWRSASSKPDAPHLCFVVALWFSCRDCMRKMRGCTIRIPRACEDDRAYRFEALKQQPHCCFRDGEQKST